MQPTCYSKDRRSLLLVIMVMEDKFGCRKAPSVSDSTPKRGLEGSGTGTLNGGKVLSKDSILQGLAEGAKLTYVFDGKGE